jgi:DNA-binding SARP family transcriptional activator
VVDVSRFLIQDMNGRDLEKAGDVEGALITYQAALACWSGPMLAEEKLRLREHPTAVSIRHARMRTVLAHADLCLAHSRPSDAAEQLLIVVGGEAFHEGLHARLIRSLTALGDRDGAIAAYSKVRQKLAEELGVEPGPELRCAYSQALRSDACDRKNPYPVRQ